MLPASNSGVGMNMGFPDVCVTPVGPVPVPIPYPNMAMNAMAVPFAARRARLVHARRSTWAPRRR